MKRIVILGGSYAGISTAHRIFKQGSRAISFKITLVSPNDEIYWNMAAPRAAAGVWNDEKVFQPIVPGFKQYGTKFEFILDQAQGLDPNANTVELASGKTLEYDILILATGSRTNENTPFKGLGSTKETKEAIRVLREAVKASKTIAIGGGGPTGIEFAGELAFAYGKERHIHLIAGGAALSPESPVSVQSLAATTLSKLGVDVKFNARVVSTSSLPTGQTEVTLSDGSKLKTDLYVPTYGLIPNSSYVPSELLTSRGYVVVDQYLRVKGTNNVYAIGDVADMEWKQFVFSDKQSTYVAKSIALLLSDKTPMPYKATATSGRLLGFSLGPKTGTGAFGNFKIPSFIISMARKELFTQNMEPMVSGTLG